MARGALAVGTAGAVADDKTVVVVERRDGVELRIAAVPPAFAPQPHGEKEDEEEDKSEDAGDNDPD